MSILTIMDHCRDKSGKGAWLFCLLDMEREVHEWDWVFERDAREVSRMSG